MEAKTLLLATAAGAALLWRKQRWLDLHGRCVLVTGGSRGLGFAIALEAARQGARVGLLARDADELRSAQQRLAELGHAQVDTFVCDLREPDQITEAVRAAHATWGRIDVLVNNAGVIQVGPVEHMGLADFEQAMAIHFWAPLHTTRAVVPLMRSQGGGRIVNISSIGGKVAIPHMAPYCASKHALVGLSDALRAELSREHIYVTTVTPGLMRTGSHPNVQTKGKHQEEYSWFSLSLAAPGLSMSAERAARRIVRACQRGERALELTLPAKLAMRANAFLPASFGSLMVTANRMLPGTHGAAGDIPRSGWLSASRVSPSILTRRADREVAAHNELHAAPRR